MFIGQSAGSAADSPSEQERRAFDTSKELSHKYMTLSGAAEGGGGVILETRCLCRSEGLRCQMEHTQRVMPNVCSLQ